MTVEIVSGYGGLPAVWLLTYLLHSSVLIGGAWVVTRALGRPRVRDVVWRFALFGGVVTASAVVPGQQDRRAEEIAERITTGRGALERARLELAGSVPALIEDEASSAVRHAAEATGASTDDARPEAVLVRLRRTVARTDDRGVRGPEVAAAAGVDSGVPPAIRSPIGSGAGRWLPRETEPGGTARVAPRTTVFRVAADAPAESACGEAVGRSGDLGDVWARRLEEACGRSGWRWHHALVVLWLLGATAGIVPLAGSWRALRSLESSSEPAGPRTRRLLDGLGRRGRATPVVTSDRVGAPCVLTRGRIGVPSRCEVELGDGELRAVLAHELAHVVRRDAVWLGLGRLVIAIFWLQPLNRLALAGAVEAAEELCDDWALARTGERIGLAVSISRVAQWVVASPAPAGAISMVGRARGTLTARVQRILDGTPSPEPRWHGVVAGALIALPLAWLPAVPQPAEVHASFRIEGEVTETRWVTEAGGHEVETVKLFVARMERP